MGNVKIQRVKGIEDDALKMRTEIRKLRDVRDELAEAVNALNDYEKVYPASKKSALNKSITEIIRSLKTIYKNMKNYEETIEIFNKNDFTGVDISGGKIPKSTYSAVPSQTTSTTSTTTSGSSSSSSSSSTTTTATATVATAAVTTTAAATTTSSTTSKEAAAKSPSKIKIGGYYKSSQIKNKDGYYAMPEGDNSPKAIEPYTAIKNKSTPNYAISHGGTWKGVKYDTHTDTTTGMRYVNINGERYYCVATGSAYGEVGDKLEITTSTGQVFKAIKTDGKGTGDPAPAYSKNVIIDGKKQSVAHNFGNNQNCVVEMVCDWSYTPKSVKNSGSYNSLEVFSGSVTSIRNLGSTF